MLARTNVFQETVIFLTIRNKMKRFHLLEMPQFLCEYFITALLCLSSKLLVCVCVWTPVQHTWSSNKFFFTPVLPLNQILSWLSVCVYMPTPMGACVWKVYRRTLCSTLQLMMPCPVVFLLGKLNSSSAAMKAKSRWFIILSYYLFG